MIENATHTGYHVRGEYPDYKLFNRETEIGPVEFWDADKQTRRHAHEINPTERATYRLTGTLFFTAYFTDEGDDKHLFWHLKEKP